MSIRILPGDVFNLLTVVAFSHSGKPSPNSNETPRRWFTCRCACGTICLRTASALKRSLVRSCGCLTRREGPDCPNFKHGGARQNAPELPEHRAWRSAKERCTYPKASSYERYGGRGISMCAEWLNDFPAFFTHVGTKPSPKHQLDRIDNEKGYEPGNVKWSTPQEQARNRRKRRWWKRPVLVPSPETTAPE